MQHESVSRTENSARNITVASIGRIAALLMGFVSRIVFTHTLSQDYVGVYGLFFDILSVLSLSELGVGTAISFSLYKPISENDEDTQKRLMFFYKKVYFALAGVVLFLGLLVIPFMDVLIKNPPQVPFLTGIYLMFLANSVMSYFWIYKKTLLDAHQLNYVGVICQTFSWIVQTIIQIIVLVTTHNFILYLSIMLAGTLASNLFISIRADRMYPFLREKNVEALASNEKREITTNVKAMMLNKVGDVAINNTDNILLSSLVGIIAAGIYSNYFLIIASVRSVIEQIFQGISGSVGNLGTEKDSKRIRKIFEATVFLGNWVYSVSAVVLYEVLEPFVSLCFGENYVFNGRITLILCINFYLSGLCYVAYIFRDSLGLFYFSRYKAIIAAVINIVSSIILGKKYGTAGIFIGTIICTITTSIWVEPYFIFKKRIKESVLPYFLKLFGYLAVTTGLGFLCHYLCGLFHTNYLFDIVLKALICFSVMDIGLFVIFGRTKEFRLLWSKFKSVLIAWKKNNKEKEC